MTTATHPTPTAGIAAIPLREALPWVIFAGLICLLGVYFVGAEEGATSFSRACTCTNSCTTAAICSASPATDRVSGPGQGRTCFFPGRDAFGFARRQRRIVMTAPGAALGWG